MRAIRQQSRALVAISLLFFFGLSLAAVVHAQDSDYSHYYYFKEKRELHLDPSRLAILDRWSEAESARAEIETLLIAAAQDTPQLVRQSSRGWSLFRLSEASASTELAQSGEMGMSSLLSALASLDVDDRYFFAPVFAQGPETIYPTDSVLVRFREGTSLATVSEVLKEEGASGFRRDPLGLMPDGYQVRGVHSGIESLKLANRLAQRSEVVAAGPDMAFTGRSASVPTDQYFINSWGLHNIGQFSGTIDIDVDGPEAWNRTTGSPQILTMIIDTGVEYTHPDLNAIQGVDSRGQGPYGEPFNECDNHGTPVAGIIGSIINNTIGTVGVAPEALVVSGRAMESNAPCPNNNEGWVSQEFDTLYILDWALSHGVRVTNNSNGYGFTSALIETRYQDTRDQGMIHFASAGNDANSAVWYPASIPSVHAVTAIDRNGALASFSSWGPTIAFTGPGVTLASTDRTGADGFTSLDYGVEYSGTSFSSPMVAGMAALLLSQAWSLDADEVDQLLKDSATDLGTPGWDQYFGWGLPNADAALEALDVLLDDFESGDTSEWSGAYP